VFQEGLPPERCSRSERSAKTNGKSTCSAHRNWLCSCAAESPAGGSGDLVSYQPREVVHGREQRDAGSSLRGCQSLFSKLDVVTRIGDVNQLQARGGSEERLEREGRIKRPILRSERAGQDTAHRKRGGEACRTSPRGRGNSVRSGRVSGGWPAELRAQLPALLAVRLSCPEVPMRHRTVPAGAAEAG